MGLAGGGLAAFVATVPTSAGSAPLRRLLNPAILCRCDFGIGLAAFAVSPVFGRTLGRRLGALLALGIAVAAMAVTAFPQCLADPYAGLDPRLQQFWLNQVTEAQSFWRVLSERLGQGRRHLCHAHPRAGRARLAPAPMSNAAVWILMAFLTAAFAVSLWQVRGATFSLPLAAIALAAWVGDWRHRTALTSDRTSMLRMALVWLVSLNVTWSAAAHAASAALGETAPAATPTGTCERPADYALLAAQPPTTVLAISNLGAPILARTPHRVLAGPYHRNVIGNLLTLDAFMGTAEQARPTIEAIESGLSPYAAATPKRHC